MIILKYKNMKGMQPLYSSRDSFDLLPKTLKSNCSCSWDLTGIKSGQVYINLNPSFKFERCLKGGIIK